MDFLSVIKNRGVGVGGAEEVEIDDTKTTAKRPPRVPNLAVQCRKAANCNMLLPMALQIASGTAACG
ncbi:hypothetical protein Pmani_005738 [Petrolisthes manimaculis]|uniref:Uncharacterized protein n=1 Tax=Petrolisthes manimaculis TaxID=1843537 RepID=A0AAE1QB44_9EUCA|nr:hypothetical protein Pmani_005738 [Petrolisthes manimaculis]